MYESKKEAPLPPPRFLRRLILHALAAASVLGFSLAVGMTGYMKLEHLRWDDAFINTTMLLGGMGPVNPPVTTAGKLFAGCFALYAGIVFIVTAALLFTPVLHRLLHHFHWDDSE